ncbi:glutamyl-tRNA reductase, partial [Halorubrum sp. Ea1]
AEFVAGEVDTPSEAVSLADLPAVVHGADLVISATGSPEPVIEPEHVADAGRLVCIDIAQPRDVDPAVADRDELTLYDIDALEDVTRRTRESREAEAREVEAIIDEELDRILRAYKRKRADDAISAMYAGADRVKAREVDRALSKLEAQGDLTDEQRETVSDMADALVGQLLAAPTSSLRDAAGEDDWETIRTALRLFDPEFDAPPEVPGGTSAEESGPEIDGPPESIAEELDD